MIMGICSALFFVIICLKYPVRKLKLQKLNKILSKIHLPVVLLLLITSVLHIIMVFPLLNARPVYVIISGSFGILSFFISMIKGLIIRKSKKQLSLHRSFMLIACIFITIHFLLNIISLVDYQNQVNSITIDTVDISEIADGKYIGECNVTFIYVKVSVTVKSGVIIQIDILDHKNERGASAERVGEDILTRQKIEVDTVSGATNSSNVIKKAVENALLEK